MQNVLTMFIITKHFIAFGFSICGAPEQSGSQELRIDDCKNSEFTIRRLMSHFRTNGGSSASKSNVQWCAMNLVALGKKNNTRTVPCRSTTPGSKLMCEFCLNPSGNSDSHHSDFKGFFSSEAIEAAVRQSSRPVTSYDDDDDDSSADSEDSDGT